MISRNIYFLYFSQASVFQRVTSSGVGLGQSGDGSADDAAPSGDGYPWQPAQRPSQAGGSVRSSPGPRWTRRWRVEGGRPRSPEL